MPKHHFTKAERAALVDETCAVATTPDRQSVIRTIDAISQALAANTRPMPGVDALNQRLAFGRRAAA